jgi:hypothetical protein
MWAKGAEERANQSGFSFELEELSTKFAGLKEEKKRKSNSILL